jgi:O-antigen/teichoic acid export membrane protein
MLVSKIAAFAMLPVYTRYLSPADYGTLQLIELTFEVVTIVAGNRLVVGVFHFYHKAASDKERRAVIATTLFLMVATYSLATAAAFLGASALSELVFRTPANADLVRIAALGLGVQSLLLVPLAYLQVRERSQRYVVANLVKLAMQLTLNVVTIVAFGMGAKGVLVSTLIANAVVGLWLCTSTIREIGVNVSARAARWIVGFSVPLVIMQVATFISTYGDRYFLQRAFTNASDGDAAVGIYGLAYQFGFLLATVGYVPFASIWFPMRFEIAKRPDRDALYARAFVYFNVVNQALAVVIGLVVYDLLRIMATPPFVIAASLVPVILLAYIIQGWTDFQNVGLLITERTGLLSLANWIATGVALLGYALLIPRYHGMGAAWATVAAFAVRHLTVYTLSQRHWRVRYEWGPVLRLLLLSTGIVAVGMALPTLPLAASLAARAGLLALYVIGAWSARILNEEDRAIVRRLIRSPSRTFSELRRSFAGSSP